MVKQPCGIHYGLDSMTVVEKDSMRDLILRGHTSCLSHRGSLTSATVA